MAPNPAWTSTVGSVGTFRGTVSKHVRILVTNDDGVEAPGIAALASAAASTGHEVVVVAPLEDWSGASCSGGCVLQPRRGRLSHIRDRQASKDVPTYGVDGPPALGVILACVGGFGARPDMVLSGINHGVNVGRSALHSGTIGAVLTAAQFGIRGLATSIRYGPDPVPWETAVTISLEHCRSAVLQSAPDCDSSQLERSECLTARTSEGVRAACLGRGGTIRSVTYDPKTVKVRRHERILQTPH